MEFNRDDLEFMESVIDEDKKRNKKYRAMALAGYGIAAAGLAMGGLWAFGTTAAVGESVLAANMNTAGASALFAGAGVLAGAVLSIKDRGVKKVVKNFESLVTTCKIKRRWSFKPYSKRKIVGVTPMSAEQQAKSTSVWKRMINRAIRKRYVSEDQAVRILNHNIELKGTSDSLMPNPMNRDEESVNKVEPESKDTQIATSLDNFNEFMLNVSIDDENGRAMLEKTEVALKSGDEDQIVLHAALYQTEEGASAGRKALLEGAMMLDKTYYPLNLTTSMVYSEADKDAKTLDDCVFNKPTEVEAYYNQVCEMEANNASVSR